MSYFRSYFEKNNTIIKNSLLNSAKNPATEIFYGSGFSKFIFKVDFTTLIEKVSNNDLVIDENTRHYLKMTNTIFGDERLKGHETGSGKERATSFDLIIFKISEFWDEGVGFDSDQTYDFTTGQRYYDVRPSNWYNRTTIDPWTTPGIYGSPEILQTIHFDNGDENLVADITTYVNEILSGSDNYGLGIAFQPIFESFNSGNDKSVAFFTKYTQTFFEPFVESIFDDTIQDNRLNFIEHMDQNLYLYVTKGTNFYNLDNLPLVDITDASGNVIPGLDNFTATLVRKGVYKVTFGITGVICDGRRFYYDKWKNLSVNGVQISDITQKFIPKPYTAGFTIGENQTELEKYAIQFFGIKQGEKIKRGELRKVLVTFRSINVPKTQVFNEVFYRMYVVEGHTQVIVHDWTKIDSTNENSFVFDTSYFIPREYTMEIKGKTHTEEIFYNNQIKFEIVSEK